MSAFRPSVRRAPIGSTVAILAAMVGLALAGCSHPANNTDNLAESGAAASDAGVTAMPAGSSAPNMGNAASSTDSSMMSSTTVSSTPSGGD
ncbi:MAG TPA: hypothetical protein VHZ26_09535 [Caulobacteraceae bacterium]|jgi:hypothetical protein|nr:hypothetical protein [Caulobacteraceae bacterium]